MCVLLQAQNGVEMKAFKNIYIYIYFKFPDVLPNRILLASYFPGFVYLFIISFFLFYLKCKSDFDIEAG